jgi:uncharacterized protein YndB with AHSA1/START domain
MGKGLRLPVARVGRDIMVPPAAVWRLLTDVQEWPRWGPSVRRAALDDGGSELSAGAQGTVWTAVGLPVRFTITDFEPGRRWAWTVAGVAATGHEVIAIPGGCRVRFDVPWWAVAYLPVCAAALNRIEALV